MQIPKIGMIPVFLFGGYRNRQPLAYSAIRNRIGDRIELVDSPNDALLLVISHHNDFDLFAGQIWDLLTDYPQLRLVMLSEEPFWDSVWMPDPLSRHQRLETPWGSVDYTVLNHQTSRIFRSSRIPYFLLTDPRYVAHYRPLIDRNAGMTAINWHNHFSSVPIDAVFLNRKREGPLLSPFYPDADLFALSAYRSEFASRCTGDVVVRQGYGWGTEPPRQELEDWHKDKLDRFDMRTRFMSGFENTHQPDYISEKIFDAFATGAVPLYMASPAHSVFRMIGSQGWLNFRDKLPDVPVFDARQPVDLRVSEGFAETQRALARLFHDQRVIEAEYDRLCDTVVEELSFIAQS